MNDGKLISYKMGGWEKGEFNIIQSKPTSRNLKLLFEKKKVTKEFRWWYK